MALGSKLWQIVKQKVHKGSDGMSLGRRFWWIVGPLIVCGIGLLIFTAYRLNWIWTGFSNKTFWDWMQLLIVPIALALVALLFNLATSRNEQKVTEQRYRNEQEIAADRQREELLQTYLDRMSEFLLNNHLRESGQNDGVRYIARARTLTVLSRLDAKRKRSLLQFLYESRLINLDDEDSVVQLVGADLSGADLSGIILRNTNLRNTNLHDADLSDADLRGADLSETNLSNANLKWASLDSTNLSNAKLNNANLDHAKLNNANLDHVKLNDANLDHANLSNANLSDVNMYRANLSRAELSGANLSDANLCDANLDHAELSGANLDRIMITNEQISKAKLSTNT